jgi:hypothetical protein
VWLFPRPLTASVGRHREMSMQISFINTDKLLGLIDEHGVIGKTKRTWSYVHRTDGGVGLMPTTGVRHLYRGQTRRYSPYLPSISRSVKGPARRLFELSQHEWTTVLINLIRSEWYCSELRKHPVFQWAASDNVTLPEVEFAQHYGIPTALVDVTESLEVALFFATHEFLDGVPRPCKEGTGILYRIDWLSAPDEVSNRFRPIAIQPFARPYRQWGMVM